MSESTPNPDLDSHKRRSTRIVQAVPLTVTGVDALGRPFQERTSTLVINCHGCRYQSKHYVLKNMWVYLEVPHNETGHPPRKARARVMWIQRPRTVRELFQIGVELEVPGNIWGIAFPQPDWFPYADATPSAEIPAPAASAEPPFVARPDWLPISDDVAQPVEPAEDKVHVLPSPGATDVPPQFAKQFARMVTEAKQQVQSAAHEAASQAVAAETLPLLASLERQLKEAAEKSVEAAVAASVEKMQAGALERLKSERDASVAAMRAEWSLELDRRIADARAQTNTQLAEVERARRAAFEEQIQSQLLTAIEKLQSLSGGLGVNASEIQTAIEDLSRQSEETATSEIRRWQELMDQREADAQARLGHLEEATKRLNEQITGATSAAESAWRGLLEADVAAASTRWNQKIEASLEGVVRQASERIARDAESFARGLEDQLQQRIGVLGAAFSQATAEAETGLNSLHASMIRETTRGQAILAQLQESAIQIQSRQNEFSSIVQASSDELARRGQALIEARSDEMNRRIESAFAGMAQRLQPVLESAGQETIGRLANELEQRLSPQISSATDLLSKLTFEQTKAEKALDEHQDLLWQTSDRSVQESVARVKDVLAQVEKEFGESARSASAKWLAELESKATETTHTTFEALYKSAEWYEKKVQTQMQSALEKGLDEAAENLREKAGEMSGLFASELDHYSRSYVEHSQNQMEEHAHGAIEIAGQQMVQAGDAAIKNFTGRSEQLARDQFESLSGKVSSVFNQHAAQIEAQAAQFRSTLESDARTLGAEFQRALSQQNLQGLAQAKQELSSQADLAKDDLRNEAQSVERQWQTSLQSLNTRAIEDYKQRLENASNSWLLTTATKLNQQSEGLIDHLAAATEEKLRSTCNSVFGEVGDTLRQRLAGLSAALPAPAKPVHIPFTDKDPQNKA